MRVRVRQHQRDSRYTVHALIRRSLKFENIVAQHSRAVAHVSHGYRVRTPVLRPSIGKCAVEQQQRRVCDGLLLEFKDGLHE